MPSSRKAGRSLRRTKKEMAAALSVMAAGKAAIRCVYTKHTRTSSNTALSYKDPMPNDECNRIGSSSVEI